MVTMWEVQAAPGSGTDLGAWALEHAPAAARVYVSADDRVVVVAPAPLRLPDLPAGLVGRAPHAWDFMELTTGDAGP